RPRLGQLMDEHGETVTDVPSFSRLHSWADQGPDGLALAHSVELPAPFVQHRPVVHGPVDERQDTTALAGTGGEGRHTPCEGQCGLFRSDTISVKVAIYPVG